METIRIFAISKLGWIKQQEKKFLSQGRESPREYLDRESHFVWGKRYLLQLVEADSVPEVELRPLKMVLQVRPGSDEIVKQAIIAQWYRGQIRAAAPDLIAKWEPLMGVQVERFYVRKMKTKWGSCNPTACTIRLNTELAKKPHECLEYIVVHEMVHLLEPTHNERFVSLMDRFMPQWQDHRVELNRKPLAHVDWTY